MRRGEFKSKAILICLLIGVVYSWVGTGYLCWIYRMLDEHSVKTVELFTNVLDYALHAAGILLFSLYIKLGGKGVKTVFVIDTFLEFVFMILAITVPSPSLSIIFAIMMDVCCGILFGCFLTYLTITKKHKGMVFGVGWSIGSLISYLMSLPAGGDFLKSPYSLIVYGFLAFISLIIILGPLSKINFEHIKNDNIQVSKRKIVFSMIIIILLEITRNIGFLFSMANLAEGTVNMEYSRAFYVVGLIIAGFVCDKSMQSGLFLCVLTLICPYISLLLARVPAANTALWAFNYSLTGFLTVYGVILFSDYAEGVLCIAAFGLLCRRIGEPIGTSIGTLLSGKLVLLIIVISLFFVITMFGVSIFWKKNYLPALLSSEKTAFLSKENDNKVDIFALKYNFSAREREVFSEVIKGNSNSKIASNLFITENTVKFHMKNILKKTSAANRKELLELFIDIK